MAITNPDGNWNSLPFSGAGGSVVMSNACASGDLMHAFISLLNATNNVPPTLTDTVNTGSYTLIGTFFDGPNSFLVSHYYKVANATGTPTVNTGSLAAIGSGAGGTVAASRYTGFVGTATIDSSFSASPTTGTGTSIAGPTLITTATPELLVGVAGVESGPTISLDNWNTNGATRNGQAFYSFLVEAGAIGSSDQWTFTGSTSSAWGLMNSGFYGLTAVPPVTVPQRGPMPKQVYILP